MKSCSSKVYVKKSVFNQFRDANYVEEDKDNDAEVDSDDLNDNFDSDDDSKPVKSSKKARVNRQGRKFKQEVDTNVMSINLKVLKEDAQFASGDPVFCEHCKAAFNMYSKIVEEQLDALQERDDEDNEHAEGAAQAVNQVWVCEFCSHKNIVVIDKDEVPDKDAINYVIEGGEGGEDVKVDEEDKQDNQDGSSLIFCIDTSGSMNAKCEINWDAKQIQSMTQKMNKNSQTLGQTTSQSNRVNLLSRLECVKAAINSQIEIMKVASSSKKVGLVTFESNVNIVGDGTQKPKVISTNDMLMNYENLLECAQDCSRTHMSTKIGDTFEDLQNKICLLRSSGSTALGPAVLCSIAMAGEGSKGSTVVICTDGVANVGLGKLEREDTAEAEEFYEKLADFANEQGVTINIISIKGQDCDLETLATLSEKTNGVVNVIEPNNLQDNFEMMLKKEVIASNVSVKVHLHKALEFRNEPEEHINADKTLMNRNIGNATNESEITFEYKIKTAEELKQIEGFSIDDFKEIPFQTIIEYTKLNGMKCIRTLTQRLEVTNDKEEAEKNANIKILAVNSAQQTYKFARRGGFREAQAYTMNQRRFMQRNMRNDEDKQVYLQWRGAMGKVYDQLHEQNNREEQVNIRAARMPEDERVEGRRRRRGYVSKMGDEMSKNINEFRNFNSDKFK